MQPRTANSCKPSKKTNSLLNTRGGGHIAELFLFPSQVLLMFCRHPALLRPPTSRPTAPTGGDSNRFSSFLWFSSNERNATNPLLSLAAVWGSMTDHPEVYPFDSSRFESPNSFLLCSRLPRAPVPRPVLAALGCLGRRDAIRSQSPPPPSHR